MELLKRRALITFAVIIAAAALMAFQLTQFTVNTSLNHWHSGAKGYQSALALQKTTHKPVVVFFHTDWCASCKRLRENVLATPEFDQYLENVIPVKINPESGSKEREIADNYGVTGYPVFLLINANADKVTRIRTSQNLSPQQFIDQCKAAQHS
ncbi:MAG: thioredoxin family protein [Gammaproteobacteria bacterium]|nr:thioredoxin family protein [Gammaproteobacteria bacterium]